MHSLVARCSLLHFSLPEEEVKCKKPGLILRHSAYKNETVILFKKKLETDNRQPTPTDKPTTPGNFTYFITTSISPHTLYLLCTRSRDYRELCHSSLCQETGTCLCLLCTQHDRGGSQKDGRHNVAAVFKTPTYSAEGMKMKGTPSVPGMTCRYYSQYTSRTLVPGTQDCCTYI